MAKSELKFIARKQRSEGESIKVIAKNLSVSPSTVSLWCRDVELTPEQIEKLRQSRIKGGYAGRMKGARMQYQRRLDKIERFKKEGVKEMGKLSDRDLLISGLALYWGEGAKKARNVRLSNSDPRVIKFTVRFFKKIFGIKNNEITAYIGINKIHKERIKEVENFWSKVIGIPKEQFTKTTLIEAKNQKNYSNFSNHYGTVTIKIRKSSDLYYRIMGLIEGLK